MTKHSFDRRTFILNSIASTSIGRASAIGSTLLFPFARPASAEPVSALLATYGPTMAGAVLSAIQSSLSKPDNSWLTKALDEIGQKLDQVLLNLSTNAYQVGRVKELVERLPDDTLRAFIENDIYGDLYNFETTFNSAQQDPENHPYYKQEFLRYYQSTKKTVGQVLGPNLKRDYRIAPASLLLLPNLIACGRLSEAVPDAEIRSHADGLLEYFREATDPNNERSLAAIHQAAKDSFNILDAWMERGTLSWILKWAASGEKFAYRVDFYGGPKEGKPFTAGVTELARSPDLADPTLIFDQAVHASGFEDTSWRNGGGKDTNPWDYTVRDANRVRDSLNSKIPEWNDLRNDLLAAESAHEQVRRFNETVTNTLAEHL